jgi:hypothetical protein
MNASSLSSSTKKSDGDTMLGCSPSCTSTPSSFWSVRMLLPASLAARLYFFRTHICDNGSAYVADVTRCA